MDVRAIGGAQRLASGQATPRSERAAVDGEVAVLPETSGAALELPQAVAALNRAVAQMTRDVVFTIDGESKQPIVRVIDRETQQVIRQLPSAEAIEIARALDRMQGMIVRRRV